LGWHGDRETSPPVRRSRARAAPIGCQQCHRALHELAAEVASEVPLHERLVDDPAP